MTILLIVIPTVLGLRNGRDEKAGAARNKISPRDDAVDLHLRFVY